MEQEPMVNCDEIYDDVTKDNVRRFSVCGRVRIDSRKIKLRILRI